MHQQPFYPKRPVRTTFVVFLALAAFISLFIPFEERLRGKWPFAYAYCALLAVSTVGLARLGRRAMSFLIASAAIASLPAVIGIAIFLVRGPSIEFTTSWIQVSLYLFYLLGALGLLMVVKGWLLYFQASDAP
jgi:hypothetical protein